MIKTLSLIKRLPTLDRAGFREHYESRHAPLALPHLVGLSRYVRYHVEQDLFGEIGFDVISAFWYRDREATNAIFEMLESEAGKAILEDELCFMDKPANRFFAVSERRWLEGEEGDEHVFVFVARPEAMSRSDCSRRLTDDHWPSLISELEGVEFAFLRDAFPMEGDETPWDGVMQLRAASYAGLSKWAERLERDGYRVAAAATRRFETELTGD